MGRFYIICFDVRDKKRLRKVAVQMENFGERVQYSVFECHLDKQELADLKKRLKKIIKQNEDHIRYYGLCHKDKRKILLDGRGTSLMKRIITYFRDKSSTMIFNVFYRRNF